MQGLLPPLLRRAAVLAVLPPLPPALNAARVSPSAPLDVPLSLALACSGAAVFFYLHMDCLDGKQARRTKNSSPLGQLFDHGALGRLSGAWLLR